MENKEKEENEILQENETSEKMSKILRRMSIFQSLLRI